MLSKQALEVMINNADEALKFSVGLKDMTNSLYEELENRYKVKVEVLPGKDEDTQLK